MQMRYYRDLHPHNALTHILHFIFVVIIYLVLNISNACEL